jgi:hypothetical protein
VATARVSFLVQPHNRPARDVVLSGFGATPDFINATPLLGVSRRWRSRTWSASGFPAPEELVFIVPPTELSRPWSRAQAQTRWP